ncbi:AraC family transcriptional regulator [Pseudomonas citronellolis]|uniref:AraC family transcriptional regulator n=1 Tax=Pseudomonas citronellolis TaxID=53408 RepID=UPI002647ED1D|nr:AraC family transcriptional regulator [Pseudomonas citronellolis]MDN6875707.1 AraC family transcriptional regulator [Pseudomonas citronellolis]
MSDFVLPMPYLRQIAEQLRAMQKDAQAWFARSGLDERQLDEPGFQLGFPQFQQLLRDAIALTAEPALGLLIGERLVVNTHGILGYAAMQSGTLRQALELLQRYLALRTTLFSLSYECDERAGRVQVRFQPGYALGDIERTVLEAVMLAVSNIFAAMTLGSCPLRQVSLPFAVQPYAALAEELFRCPVAYGQSWAGFSLDLAVIDQPLKLADPAAFREAEAICRRELERLGETASMGARVRRTMLEKQNGFPSLKVTARLFHMTPRTLHRHLLAEGTSFKLILEDVRRTLAIEHLKAGHLSIEEIAYTLGYTDLANFRRAFKRWEGMPPSAYRASLGAQLRT